MTPRRNEGEAPEPARSPDASQSSICGVEGADWAPHLVLASAAIPPSDSRSLSASPKDESREDESDLSSPSPQAYRLQEGKETPEGSDWMLPPEVLSNLERDLESRWEKRAAAQQLQQSQQSQQEQASTDTSSACPCCRRPLHSAEPPPVSALPTEHSSVDASYSSYVHQRSSKPEFKELFRKEGESQERCSEECKSEKEMSLQALSYAGSDEPASQTSRWSEPCQEPEPKVGTQSVASSIQQRMPSPGEPYIETPIRQLSKQLQEITPSLSGAVMNAATPLRGSTANQRQQHKEQLQGSSAFRTPPLKTPALPFSTSTRKSGNTSTHGRSGSTSARTGFMFNASPRSLALGPPRNGERRQSDRIPARSPPPQLPFSDKTRSGARQLSPQASCRSEVSARSPQRSVRMSPHGPPAVPQFCSSTGALPDRTQHASNRGNLYPMPGVSRFSTSLSGRDTSAAKARTEVSQPPAFRSPTRSQSLGPSSMHSIVVPTPPSKNAAQTMQQHMSPSNMPPSIVAPNISSFMPPGQPPPIPAGKMTQGSYVAVPQSNAASFVAGAPMAASQRPSFVAAPLASQRSPDPRHFREGRSPERSLLAPPLPYTLQVAPSDRSIFMAAVPGSTSCVAAPSSNAGRTNGQFFPSSPPMSFVAAPPVPPPLPQQGGIQRTASFSRSQAITSEDRPGRYKLLDHAIVRAESALESAKLFNDGEMLLKDSVVTVVEVRQEQDRIRGRLEEPSGWITLWKPAANKRMAERIM